MSRESNEIDREHEEQEEFNVQLVKYNEPIIIKDESNAKEENNEVKRRDDHPTELDDLFSYIFPPQEWEEDKKTFRRTVSTKPANQVELISLNRELDRLLTYWRANPKGLCVIRRELYSQCFDELIRQVCLINIDQGEMLIRIRNEFVGMIEAYKYNYENATMFNDRKTTSNQELNTDVKILSDKNQLLQNQLRSARQSLAFQIENEKQELKILTDRNAHRLEFMTKNNEALEAQVKMLISMKK